MAWLAGYGPDHTGKAAALDRVVISWRRRRASLQPTSGMLSLRLCRYVDLLTAARGANRPA